ncbi:MULTISPECIES: hypothetical protein [Kitasatospora]|uniref:Beta-ketoacyl synthase N-terminal domain-containing protein n=1 Tax=Kitasatospora setae (strain ATCC 33774 / DSM 43861 / JCM 3304 / KCC A-0304 / NBRC 14216 / KM-6054) TaxID=452652 RepID=E4N2G4_KITSK|nr:MULTISPECIES: hypothetical protein [Kitasatospora]BAJ32348.1 hypothetical protein KSE_65890 [Kitasatospora setae KM-6054]
MPAVRLERVLSVPLDGERAAFAADSPEAERTLRETRAVYGPAAGRDWLDRSSRLTFPTLVRAARTALGPLPEVDLALTAAATPDCRTDGFPGALLGHLLGGHPTVLGITEQGTAGPFTALRIAAGRIRAGDARRALVLLLEQSTLPAEPGFVRPERDAAVALLLGPGPGRELGAPVVGRTPLDPPAGAHPVRPDRGGSRIGAWTALARELPALDPDLPLLIADDDHDLGYHCHVLLAPHTPEPAPHRIPQNPEERARA